MCVLQFAIVAIFSSTPVLPHFIWPLSMCILADICNHTWIPECGEEITSFTDYRLFIDDCDMYEYNCDHFRNYIITNYTDCFAPFTGCPTHPKAFYRMGNYKFVLKGRKMIYAPTEPIQETTTPKTTFIPPTLPMRMLKGKRRYTPEARKRMLKKINMLRFHTRTVLTTEMMTKRKASKVTTAKTFIIKKIPVVKDGKKFMKIIKGFRKRAKKASDSNYLE